MCKIREHFLDRVPSPRVGSRRAVWGVTLRDGVTITASMQRSGPEGPAAPCVEVRRLVFEFLDDELAPAQVERIEAHLIRCSPCAGFVAFERTFLAVVRKRVPIDQAPAELRDRIRAALADRKKANPPS